MNNKDQAGVLTRHIFAVLSGPIDKSPPAENTMILLGKYNYSGPWPREGRRDEGRGCGVRRHVSTASRGTPPLGSPRIPGSLRVATSFPISNSLSTACIIIL